MVKPLLIVIVIVFNDVTSKLHELRLITKERVATHTNLILLFKHTLYSSTLVIKLFKSFEPKFLL